MRPGKEVFRWAVLGKFDVGSALGSWVNAYGTLDESSVFSVHVSRLDAWRHWLAGPRRGKGGFRGIHGMLA